MKKGLLPFSLWEDWENASAREGQLLSIHSENVSVLASQFGSKCGATDLLRIAGFLHDLGKKTSEFQDYLRDKEAKRGSVKHSAFGAKRAYDCATFCLPAAEILGNSIAAHHGRLYDHIAPDGCTPLQDKLDDPANTFTSVDCANADTDTLKYELDAILTSMPANEKPFGISMLAKFIYSCLVDADRLDAYLFECGTCYTPQTPNWNDLLSQLECRLADFDGQSDIDKLRNRVSSSCAKAGSRAVGIYKLEVPTGGGKTLASLRFALEHARRNALDRIIYVIPYLSILNQTASDIHKALKVDNNVIVEHHSNFLPDDLEQYELLTDRWDAPIILTTQVQFLESVFSAKGGDLRKLHNMARSVIIFDEAQSLPIKCVHLFNSAVNFLSRVCGSTILLCTATQPLLDTAIRPVLFSENPGIADCGPAPERTRIVNAMMPGGYTYPQLAAFVLEKHTNSTLIIVNTKAAAKMLYEQLKHVETPVLHLSTNMCSAHRDMVIETLRHHLASREPVICVSTQLIEAGVDISFECVIREIAGLDSILQAAGRCNRNGEFGEVKNVYIINIMGENLDKLPDIKIGAQITQRLLADGNLDIHAYYRHYFHERRRIMDYPLDDGGTLYDLLSKNACGENAYKNRKDKQHTKPPALRPALRSAADAFFVIDQGRKEVVVPYGESEVNISNFITEKSMAGKRKMQRELGRYCVSLYQYQWDALTRSGALYEREGITVLKEGFYNKERGMDLDGNQEFLCL